jgi:antitoxin Phd
MATTWQLQEAKNRFSEVVDEALREGPQVITRRGVETAVVLSFVDYRRMTLAQGKLGDFFAESPLAGVDLDLTRNERHFVNAGIAIVNPWHEGNDSGRSRAASHAGAEEDGHEAEHGDPDDDREQAAAEEYQGEQ